MLILSVAPVVKCAMYANQQNTTYSYEKGKCFVETEFGKTEVSW